ncbi:MAG TPA: SPOR domain-containing protein, partial [Thermoanaerobaculia bacterium]|nr:SPOR domain-containing protein [Thermoanaerobaculia bacterium]
LRLSAHASSGRFSAAAWADRQRHAPTLELIFRDAPGLDLALLRLGITVRNPDDVARALRDNAALIDLGYITGVNVDLTPRRLQAGLNLGWAGANARSDRLRLLAVYSRDEGIRATRDSLITTVTYSRQILSATDLYGSFSWWQTALRDRSESGQTVDVGVRQQFSGLPRWFRRSGTVEGFVFLDPAMGGMRTLGSPPLSDVEVTLDAERTTRTDGTGAYAFRDVAPGAHTVAARLPAMPRSFFTTASHAETKGPARVDFGVVWAAARIAGRVISDAGTGVPGVVLSAIALRGIPISATSDAEGGFVFAVPPGSFRIVLAPQSLPPGYSISGPLEQKVMAETDRPQAIAFPVQARRSIAGYAAGASEVRIESLGMSAPVDSAGYFLFRTMPAGTFTLTADIGDRVFSRTLTVPPPPTMIDEVVLGTPPAPRPVVAVAADASVVARNPIPHLAVSDASHLVQAGAFRNARNARELVNRLYRGGEEPFTASRGGMTFVYVGPFPTADEAAKASRRLHQSGFEAFVTHRTK